MSGDYEIMWTKDKMKKAKIWNDGVLNYVGNKAVLKDEDRVTLDSKFMASKHL
jgi:hypothetical protein